jgi:hypothetical protein
MYSCKSVLNLRFRVYNKLKSICQGVRVRPSESALEGPSGGPSRVRVEPTVDARSQQAISLSRRYCQQAISFSCRYCQQAISFSCRYYVSACCEGGPAAQPAARGGLLPGSACCEGGPAAWPSCRYRLFAPCVASIREPQHVRLLLLLLLLALCCSTHSTCPHFDACIHLTS